MEQRNKLYAEKEIGDADIGLTVTRSAFAIAEAVKAKAIITPTLHGNTTRLISRFRPSQLILAVTPDKKIARQLLLNWGVIPMLCPVASDSDEMIQNSIKKAKDEGAVQFSDRIVVTASIPLHSPLMANNIKVLLVGTVLARGTIRGFANQGKCQASGRIVIASTAKEAAERAAATKTPVLVCGRITEDFIPALRMVEAVIAENGSDLSDSRLSEINKNLVWITDARSATDTLESGYSVTVDGKQGLVYEGII